MAQTIPNFDCLTEKDLMAFWSKYRRPSRRDAEELIGDRRKGFTNVAGLFANYACNKATAMACRVRGDILAASIYETHCDLIYKRLPKDLLW